MKIRLTTRDGCLVGEATVPEFKLLPEVMVWGSRIFVFALETREEQLHRQSGPWVPTYREGCAWHIPGAVLDGS